MKIIVTKRQIVEAIANEPYLFPGNWIEYRGSKPSPNIKARSKQCTVCAVGSVLQDVLSRDTTVGELGILACRLTPGPTLCYGADYNSIEEIHRAAAQYYIIDDPLSVLSFMFEGAASFYGADMIGLNDISYDKMSRGEKLKIASTRRETIKFVKKNFPEEIELDIGGLKPSPGTKIVRE